VGASALNRGGIVAIAILKRLAGALLLICGASALIYFTIRSAPGNAIDAITPMGTPPEVQAQLAADFGLDKGPISGFFSWLAQAVQGDFGESLVTSPGAPVLEEAIGAYVSTMVLAIISLFVCIALALGLAVLLAEEDPKQQKFTGTLYVLTTAPCFIVAVFLIEAINRFVQRFIDQAGYVPPEWYALPKATDSVMPMVFAGVVLILGDGLFMDTFNSIRSQLNTLKSAQFISAIRSKGARTFPHLARNMLVPLVSCFAARLPMVLGGVVIVEYIFTLEGAGYLLLEAARLRDFPLVVGICVLFTVTVIVVHLIADLVKAAIDPREVARGG